MFSIVLDVIRNESLNHTVPSLLLFWESVFHVQKKNEN